MYKVLFLPLLNIPTGHHHVADSIAEQLRKQNDLEYICEKIDLLSECYGKLESFISSLYIQSIHKFPSLYSQLYKSAAGKIKENRKHYRIYEILFLNKLKQIIEQRNPDLLICTHAFPSYLLNCLKQKQRTRAKIINVYTDYFINQLWGIDAIDYHFVPSHDLKEELILRGVKPEKIYVTGIPLHPSFKINSPHKKKSEKKLVIISGGNLGVGSIEKFLKQLNPSVHIHYKVLCGNNGRLMELIKQMNHPNIEALPYIHCKQKMNELYELADAIITKPGGVTITECLWKRVPIIVYESLPGQEEFNLHYLQKQKFIFHLQDWRRKSHLESSILEFLNNHSLQMKTRYEQFSNKLENHKIEQIINQIVMQA